METKPERREQIAKWMGNMALFGGMLEAGTPIMQNYDRTRLEPMYERVRKTIRQVDLFTRVAGPVQSRSGH